MQTRTSRNRGNRRQLPTQIARIAACLCCLFLIVVITGCGASNSGNSKDTQNKITFTAKESRCEDCNIIIIGATNVHRNHLETYGYYRETSPNIDAFAQKSMVFENAFVSSSWTLPSFSTIMTSLYPLQHRVMVRYLEVDGKTFYGTIDQRSSKLDQRIITLADVLEQYNYTTAAFSGGFDLLPRHGVSSRFDENHYSTDIENRGQASNDSQRMLERYGSFNYSAPLAAQWVKEHKEDKFFIYVQGFDAHCPFALPEKNEVFANDKRINIAFDKCYWTFKPQEPITIKNKRYYSLLSSEYADDEFLFPQEAVDYMVDLYDGEIQLADGHIGRLLKAVDDEGLLDNTIIIILSEHGDLFGKHGRFMRGGPLRGTFYDDVLNVPLILYHPKLHANGTTRHSLIESTDIAPTLLALLEKPIPESFKGTSALPIILNDTPTKDRVYAGAQFFPSRSNEYFSEATLIASIRTQEWKLIVEFVLDADFTAKNKLSENMTKTIEHTKETTFELYNIHKDPQELINQINESPAVFNALHEELMEWLSQTEATQAVPGSGSFQERK